MIYVGSKRRIAKYIMPIILKNRKENQWYVEPFCGGCNTLKYVDGKRLMSDKNKYLIAMWKGLQEGIQYPREITKEMWLKAKEDYKNNTNNYYDDFMIGWIGFMSSFRGIFFSSYSGKSGGRDYVDEFIRNIEKQIKEIPDFKDIIFKCCDYSELDIPENSIIYCDIPYKNTAKYDVSKKFDYDKFWNWVKEKTLEGHKVFVSEYEAPEEFNCIFEHTITSALSSKKGKKVIEKLFIYEP